MAIELITGHSGEAHVSGDDVGHLLMGAVGKGKVMLGSAPSVTMTDANTCSIGACDFLLDGRHVRLTGSSVVSIANGATGSMRSDLVVARYTASASTGVESVTLEVIQGAAGSSATDPDLEYPASIADGATTADYPIVRVTLDGLNPTAKWLVAESLSLTDVVDRIGGIAGPVPVSHGGTGATTKDGARKNLGIATVADKPGNMLYNGGSDGYVWWGCRNSFVTIVWSVKQTTTAQWKAGNVGKAYAPALVVNGSLTVASWAPNGKTAFAWITSSGDLYLQCSVAQSNGRNVGSMTYFAHG